MHQWCAPESFVLAFNAGGAAVLAEIRRSAQPPSVGENVEWLASKAAVAAAQSARLSACGMPEEVCRIAQRAASTPEGRVFEVGIFDRPPLPSPAWLRRSDDTPVVLLGDAAHAMTPFLGQGANSAMQDGICLAKLLRDHALTARGDTGGLQQAVRDALGEYSKVRAGPTARQQRGSSVMGRLDTLFKPLHLVRNAALRALGATRLWERLFLWSALLRIG